jgi:hypothetical protein
MADYEILMKDVEGSGRGLCKTNSDQQLPVKITETFTYKNYREASKHQETCSI